MTILPIAYLPSVEYVARLIKEESIIDCGENYIKRSQRNRGSILSANGVMELTVHIANANRPRQPIGGVKIDYSKRWQHQHWISILSAYKSSPYFDHYAAELEPFYREEWELLVDYDIALTRKLLTLLGADCEVRLSREYVVAEEGDVDLRPKKRKEDSTFVAEPYFQVFSERMPFAPNLSVLDLLLCEGPAAIDAVLKRCRW